ncbi:MAG: VOC family protein [Anaerolineae bacterium]|nr:VOC family protein [Anaerolineae bacterium]
MPVFELRVAITAGDYERLVRFYRDGLGLESGEQWSDHGHGQILHSGKGVLEILDTQHAAHVDELEVGQAISGDIRFAFQVPDVHKAVANARQYGATILSEPTLTPWNDLNARIVSPDGMQITLFQRQF